MISEVSKDTRIAAGVTGGAGARLRVLGLLALALLITLGFASRAHAQAVSLGTADSFAVLAGSAVTNTGPTVVNGDLGVSPGTSVTGFPPGTVNGTIHANDAVAAQAQSDTTAAYNDAAGRACDRVLTGQDLGGLTLTSGVYCFASSAQLTGVLNLDAQGDRDAVFIFQIGSTLTTASGSSVNLINGAQSCNAFWQVGSSATLGTTTTFRGNILALTSITANTDATVDGRLLARNGAVTLDSNTVTRAECATGTEPPGEEGPGEEGPGEEGPGEEGPGEEGPGEEGPGEEGPGEEGPATPDSSAPRIRLVAPPGTLSPPARRTRCTERSFTVRVRVRDRSRIRRVTVYLDGRQVKRKSRPRFSVRIKARGLRVGRHRIKVVAVDRAGNRKVKRRSFRRCARTAAAPRFTG